VSEQTSIYETGWQRGWDEAHRLASGERDRLRTEIADLKASRERLRNAFVTAALIADDRRGKTVSPHYPDMMGMGSLRELGLQPGDLEDDNPAPTTCPCWTR
jgi:hypothetical protein